MDRNECQGWLGVTAERFDELLAVGMPGGEGPYDGAAIAAWVEGQGLGERVASRIVSSMGKVATEFGVSYDTVRRDWKAAGMPVLPGPEYDLDAIAAWREERKRNHAAGSPATQPINSDDEALRRKRIAEAERMELDCEMKKLRLEMERGEYCSVERVRLLFGEIAGRCRDTLMRLPSELLPMLPKEHATMIAKEVDTKVRGVLEMLCKRLCEIEEESRVDGEGNLTSEDAE